MNRRNCPVLALVVALLFVPPSRSAEPINDLLKRLPEQTNAVLLIDVQAVHKSPLAVQEKWAQKHGQDDLARLRTLPPGTRRIVIGAEVDPTTLDHVWRIGLAETVDKTDVSQLARREGATVDRLAGESVVLLPRNAYGVALSPTVLAGMQPANRQAFGRWVRFAKENPRVVVSPYLRKATERLDATHQVVMAMDLADVLDPEGVRHRLQQQKDLVGGKVDPKALAQVLTGLKGVTLTIGVDRDIQGELRVDFSDPADQLAGLGKPLVLKAMAGLGAHVEDLEGWKVRTEGNSLVLSGKLSERGARQLVSPVDPPVTTATSPTPLDEGPTADPKALASLRYFRSVNLLLDDLRDHKFKHFNDISQWYYRFAQKIDELPMVNVDPELLDYGAAVSATLRGLSNLANNTLLQQQQIATGAQEATVQTQGNYYYGYAYNRYGATRGYQYYVPNYAKVNNHGLINNMLSQARGNEAAARKQTWKNIDDTTSMIRRKMVAKYNIEF